VRRLLVSTFSAVAALALVTTAAPASAAPLSPTDQRVHDALTTRVVNRYLGSNVSGIVVDSGTGQQIWSRNATKLMLPASTMKLATAATALQAVGPDYRFTTTVRRGATWDRVVLVGAGDPSLSGGNLSTLALATANRVRAHGVRSVRVYVDDTIFPAPTNASGWLSSYVPGQVRPVRALVVDEHQAFDTSLDAGAVFVSKLRYQGVGAVLVGHGAGRSGLLLASVQAQTMRSIVVRMLQRSDNDHAEALFRLVARALHVYPSWTNAQLARRQVLNSLGISTAGTVLVDGSGLSRSDRMTAVQLMRVLQVAQAGTFPRLAVIAHGALPVAGAATGSLARSLGRYDTAPTSCAAYKLVGKTGLLHDVVSLAGYATGADGRTKTYAFVVNSLPDAQLVNKRAVDRLSSTITGCW
jgi:D-alanyl-D-alanine carboxypeptidase/D-alanyl-D-alanine-endopeptidase (penicillin-binding protein 4)